MKYSLGAVKGSQHAKLKLFLCISVHMKVHKGSGNLIAPQIMDLIVFFFRSGGKVSMKRAIFRAFHLVVRPKVQKSVPRMELFSVPIRDQDEKLGESRHKSCYGSVLVVDLLTHLPLPPLHKIRHIFFLQEEICISSVGQLRAV